MASLNVDIISKTTNPQQWIPVLSISAPVYDYTISEEEARQLIQMASLWIYIAGTKITLSGKNWYDYFPGGGGGGTSDYNDLENQPSINNITLVGNKSLSDLGIAAESDIPTVPITNIQKNGTDITPVNGTVNITVPTTAADVSALPDTTKYATTLSLTINSSTFVVTGQLKDQNGDDLGTPQTIDLPLESVVVGGSYNSGTKKVVLTLQNGNTVEFSVADLVSGLQTELSASNKLNPEYINYDSTHRPVSDTEKSTWNNKQDSLTTEQLAAVNSGITSIDVTQIETNKTDISSEQAKTTGMTEGGSNYITVGGIRVYVSATAPTGDIPDGSVGVGW